MTEGGLSVIVIEDDGDLRGEIAVYLGELGMTVREAPDGPAFDRLRLEADPDVVILDLGLPKQDGTSIARRLRSEGTPIGIVMLTARTRIEERVLGYQTGADIYLVKPVDLRELAAAVGAVYRRQRPPTVAPDPSDPAHSEAAPTWRLEPAERRLVAPSGASVRLSRAEYQVVGCLVEKPEGSITTREEIAQRMGKSIHHPDHRYVDQIVSRLRRKIATELLWEAPIGSAHGQGYYFVGLFDQG